MAAIGSFMGSVRIGIDSFAEGIKRNGIERLGVAGETENSRKAYEIVKLAIPVIAVLGALYLASKFLTVVSTVVLLGAVVVVSSPLWSENTSGTYRTRFMAVGDALLDLVPGFKDFFQGKDISDRDAIFGNKVVSALGFSDAADFK